MDNLYKPEILISSAAFSTSIFTAVYTNKQLNKFREEVQENAQHLALTIKKLQDVQNYKGQIIQLASAIRSFNDQIIKQNKFIDGLIQEVNIRDRIIEEHGEALYEIKKIFKDSGKKVNFQPHTINRLKNYYDSDRSRSIRDHRKYQRTERHNRYNRYNRYNRSDEYERHSPSYQLPEEFDRKFKINNDLSPSREGDNFDEDIERQMEQVRKLHKT